jgi:protein arginine kinase activator
VKCNKCKVNDADIFIGYLNNSKSSTVCLCESCSIESGITFHILKDDLYSSDSPDEGHLTVDYDHKCSRCSTDIKDFLANGRTGCPQCYSVFKEEINRYFRQESKVIKKRPVIDELAVELKKAVGDENYEYAATLRDRIKVLSSGEVDELIER